ncbi:MAG: hypothetical protein Q4E07_04595 [Eubacteriales bacterium]|nr:hypothetical protein [Eubacteriales bacterium]
MKTLYIALTLLWKRKFSNAILALEILLSVFMLAQTFVFITDYIDNSKAMNELPKDNVFIFSTFSYCDKEEVKEKINRSPIVESADRVYMGGASFNGVDCNLVVYPQNIIAHYKPSLKKGAWFSSFKKTDMGILPAVISSEFGASVGETRSIYLPDKGDTKIYVTGILASPTQYLYPSGGASSGQFAVSSIIDQRPVIILREVDYGDMSALEPPSDLPLPENMFVFIKPSATQEEIITFKKNYGMYGEITDMNTLVVNFLSQSSLMINNGIAFFAVFFLLAVTSILSGSIMQTVYNKKLFTVYFMLGMNPKKGAVVELIRIFVIAILVIFLTFFAGRQGWLMLEWLSETRVRLFYIIAVSYSILILFAVSAYSVIKGARTDISASLKNLKTYD